MTLRSAIRRLVSWAVNRARYDLVPQPGPPATQRRPLGELHAFLEDLRARNFRPAFIVDVGANHGDWSRAARAAFPGARLLLIEPVKALAPELEAFVRETPGAKFLAAGAGAIPGELDLTEILTADGQPTPGSTFSRNESGSVAPPSDKQVRRVKVPVVSLDSLLDSGELPQTPDLVKIDVEGYELEVLKGCHRLLGVTEMFILEVSLLSFWGQPVFHEMVAYMAAHGYAVYDFAGFNRRPLDGALGLIDVCFVRQASPLRREARYD